MSSQNYKPVVHPLLESMCQDSNAVDHRNASAYVITVQMMNQAMAINPDETANNGLNPILQLQKLGVTGARLVTLHSVICDGSLVRTFAVAKAVELSLEKAETVNAAIDGAATLDVDKLHFRVRQVASRFSAQK